MKASLKSTRALIQPALTLVLLLALMLSGCRSAAPRTSPTTAPVTDAPGQPTPAAEKNNQTVSGGEGVAGDAPSLTPTARPTIPAQPALSAALPVFDGLYWTSEVGVEAAGPESVRLVSGLPCAELIELLSAGDWRAAERALPKPEIIGLASALALLEKGDQKALVNLKDYQIAEISMDGSPPTASTPDPQFQGCAGLVHLLPIEEVSASGAEAAQGPALQYPLGMGCMYFDQHVTASFYYEGPGDFRASVSFTVPEAPGEYSVDDADLSLEMMRSNQSYVQRFAEYYEAAALGQGDGGEWGAEYWPESDDPGGVTVTAARPLTGQITLTGYAGDNGPQTFTAAFRCPE